MKKLDGVYLFGRLEEAGYCLDLGRNFAAAVEFLRRPDLLQLPDGRYELDGDNAFAMVQTAALKPWTEARPEAHRRYFDIQLPISGPEIIGVGRLDPAEPGEFDEARDLGFYDGAKVEPVTVSPGEFAVFHPHVCAHAPCCTDDGRREIRKIVVKVRAD